MRFLKQVLVSIVAVAVAMVASSAGVMARGTSPVPMALSYSGSYPVTVTGTQNGNFTGCLTLTSSGSASLVIGSQKFPGGTYLVTNHILVATLTAQGYGQNAGLLFIAHARSILADGVYEEVYGGANFQSGKLTFGMKGGC